MKTINNSNNNDKVLNFVAMGSDLKLNDELLNHRFRTVFKNDLKETFFIEFGINQVSFNSIETQKKFGIGSHLLRIDHLVRTSFKKDETDPDYREFERSFYDYANKENILKFINNYCKCSFEEINISDDFIIDYGSKYDGRSKYKIIKKRIWKLL